MRLIISHLVESNGMGDRINNHLTNLVSSQLSSSSHLLLVTKGLLLNISHWFGINKTFELVVCSLDPHENLFLFNKTNRQKLFI